MVFHTALSSQNRELSFSNLSKKSKPVAVCKRQEIDLLTFSQLLLFGSDEAALPVDVAAAARCLPTAIPTGILLFVTSDGGGGTSSTFVVELWLIDE